MAEQADAAASKAAGHSARKGSTPFLPILFSSIGLIRSGILASPGIICR